MSAMSDARSISRARARPRRLDLVGPDGRVDRTGADRRHANVESRYSSISASVRARTPNFDAA